MHVTISAIPSSTINRGANTKIEIEEHNPNWAEMFKIERELILKNSQDYIEDIQHVGSTAVPGLAAKPTIDICIGVKSLEIADKYIISSLKLMGYDYLQFLEEGIPQRRYLQKLDDTCKHLFHIHIVVKDGVLWNEYINFRDYLIKNPHIAREYEEHKLKLKELYSSNRNLYTEGKAEFINNIISKIGKN
ncbi:MAG: GrpB family protein [Neisseriaceae bacterium]|jgi:GrpB-like predicted nucleotidyltransferase (UPF0157 family)